MLNQYRLERCPQTRDVLSHVVHTYRRHTARFFEPSMMVQELRNQASLVSFQARENVNRTYMSNIASACEQFICEKGSAHPEMFTVNKG